MNKTNLTELNNNNLSIVIATIGRESLFATLDCISGWDKHPNEVIVVLPKGSNFSISLNRYPINLRILHADSKGQVSQRIYGFKHALSEFVLQLDDDLQISYTSYCEMLKFVENSLNIAASPIFIDIKTRQCMFAEPTNNLSKAKDFISSIILGADFWPIKMGSVSRAGIPYGVNANSMSSEFLQVEWVSGGCVLHRRSNLVLTNYYPFLGRAALEDLFHSFLLRQQGVNLIVCKNAICMLEVARTLPTLKTILHEYKIFREYVVLADLSLLRLRCWLLISFFMLLVNKLVRYSYKFYK
jgi:glycosyltransferase involved in cell wall biosynthesis